MRNGARQIGHLEKLLRDAIERRKPDLVAFDPFIRLHALEENDSGAMDFVCDLLTKLSIEYDIAIDAPHHTRKGQLAAGDADNGRGASSMRDAMRLLSTLTTMSEDEAKLFGVSEIDRHDYVRLDPAKVNITRRSQKATWFKLVSVKLDNGTKADDGSPGGDYPNGDEVQTVEPWTPPDTWANLSTVALNAALTEIDAGMSNGQGTQMPQPPPIERHGLSSSATALVKPNRSAARSFGRGSRTACSTRRITRIQSSANRDRGSASTTRHVPANRRPNSLKFIGAPLGQKRLPQ